MTKDISYDIIRCALKVHSDLGPGLLESIYQRALMQVLRNEGFKVDREAHIKFEYEGIDIAEDLRIDLLVNDEFIVELKSVDSFSPVHYKQLLSYLRLTNQSLGLLINFNVEHLKDGIQRVVNNHYK